MERIAIPASRPLRGTLRVPGDKSVSHRALILGALAEGETRVAGISHGADVRATRACLESLGARFASPPTPLSLSGEGEKSSPLSRKGEGPGVRPGSTDVVIIQGRGLAFAKPEKTLDAMNSGTTMRLLSGVLAGQDFETEITGDASLRRRPMKRVAEPLEKMGAKISLSENGCAPLRIRGSRPLRALDYALPVASAQVKSAVLLAGLFADGKTTVRDPFRTRDHTERMLQAFSRGVVDIGPDYVSVEPSSLRGGLFVEVPGDISSAAFFLAGACLVPDSDVVIEGAGVNPTRTGFVEVLREMGASLSFSNKNDGAIEPIADIRARHGGSLRGVHVKAERVPSLVDEVPILAVLAAQATGATRIDGLAELRVKESNRLEGLADNLRRVGARANVEGDSLIVEGPSVLRGAEIETFGDHRMAMAFAVAALAAEGETRLSDAACVDVSYPGFFEDLGRLMK